MEKIIQIKHQYIILEGMLNIPQSAQGIVLFAHGRDSCRSANNFI